MSEVIRVIVLLEGWRGDDANDLIKSVLRRRDALNAHGGQVCVTCRVHKGVTAFDVDPDEYNGLNRHCVDCEV